MANIIIRLDKIGGMVMNKISLNNNEKVEEIKSKIYKIRGIEVMLDSDLAKLYNCANGTKDVNKSVKRNIEKFPEDFYFQLTKDEYSNLKFHFGTSSWNDYGGVRKLPYVFTEQGVAMLATVLHTKVAAEVSVDIMRAFVLMRKTLNSLISYDKKFYLIENKLLNIDTKLIEHDSKLNEIFDNFKEKRNHIFFEGQIYDAYSLLLSIFDRAKEELIIIDNYANYRVLDLVSKLNVKVIIVSKNMSEELINKYNKQYHNLEIIKNDSFHDRFIIIDKKELYISGSSFKDIGNKCFGINKIEDNRLLNDILNIL